MARKLRVEYPGAIYHLMNRGDRREPIFQDDEDRQRFIVGELKRKGWTEEDLEVRRKGDVFKVRLAQRLRVETTVTLIWIAERLRIGTRGHLTHLLYWRGRKKPLKKPSSVKQYVKTID